jgi:1,4-dihydroxy-2-naphthoate octaprenyltransferase
MFKLSRPLHLLLAALTYLLGVGVANYLGRPFRAGPFWLGFLVVLFAQAGLSLLAEVFRPDDEPIHENETRSERIKLRGSLLNIAIAFLATDVVLTFLLFNNHQLPLSALFFLMLSLGIIVLYSIPPFRLLDRGFGEFLLAVQLAYVVPSIGFLFQADEYHRLLFTITLPLTLQALAYFLVLDFPSFAIDRKYRRLTLLGRLAWERAVPLHHSLVVAAYVLFLAAAFLGPSLRLLWPAFLTLPFAAMQILLLRNISLGVKPNWPLLTSTALGVFGLTAYFLTLTFWLR